MFDMQFVRGITAQLKKSILNLGLKIVNLVFVRHLLFQTVGRQNRLPRMYDFGNVPHDKLQSEERLFYECLTS